MSRFVFFLFFSVLVSLVDSKLEPYHVLGVHRRADAQEIKKAYKKMAREWHPDKNKAEDAEERFIEITKGRKIKY